jgi:hypothetical protein
MRDVAVSIVCALGIAAAGCGKTDSKPAPAAEPGSASEHHMPAMSPALDAFHKLLAPLWHAAPGEQRMADTCQLANGFQQDAARVGNETAGGAPELIAAVKGLVDACAANPRTLAAFDAAFAKVHDAFHGMLGEK